MLESWHEIKFLPISLANKLLGTWQLNKWKKKKKLSWSFNLKKPVDLCLTSFKLISKYINKVD